MPDNVGYTPGSGATIAADDVGGALLQRVKIVHGVDGANDGDVASTNPMPTQEIGGAMSWMRRIFDRLSSPPGFDMSLDRSRVTAILESGTVTTVTTVTSVSNIGGIGGYSAQMTVIDQNNSAWAQCVRARIT